MNIDINKIYLLSNGYCLESTNSNDLFVKVSFIRKLKNKWIVYSKKGKKLGSYKTKQEALKRLKQIEFFKHKKASKSKELDLTDLDSFSYSAILRLLNKTNKDLFNDFRKAFKSNFDNLVINSTNNIEINCLIKTLIDFAKDHEVILDFNTIKKTND